MVIYQQQRVADENMSSNLTSASFGEAPSASSIQQQYCSYADSMNPKKKRRSLPGNPDPEAEVVALSPKTLMATNRFVCEICNKGFQRDQNLQLHRRGHNLSWKLKQRSNKLEAPRKKVYVCPEATCVHHDPSRALGDLTGIKKHFSRRHGEKKWKCERCSKKYAVQSDWKAHSKICGTREYRCDCGTLFSRRDSFITHRAFCDALAQESARGAITANPLSGQQHQLLFSQPMTSHDKVFPFQQVTPALHSQFPHSLMRAAEAPSASIMNGGGLRGLPQDLYLIKREQQEQHKHFGGMRPDVPQWLACQGSTSTLSHLEQNDCSPVENIAEQSSIIPLPPPYHATASFPSSSISPRVLATALLQKAAQMGATMSRPPNNMAQMSAHTTNARVVVDTSSSGFGHGGLAPPPLLQGVAAAASSLPSALGFDGPFEDAFGGMLGSKSEVINGGMDVFVRSHGRSTEEGGGVGRGRAGGNDEMTRDFLGLEGPFSQQQGAGGILGLTGLEHCMPPHSYI